MARTPPERVLQAGGLAQLGKELRAGEGPVQRPWGRSSEGSKDPGNQSLTPRV